MHNNRRFFDGSYKKKNKKNMIKNNNYWQLMKILYIIPINFVEYNIQAAY